MRRLTSFFLLLCSCTLTFAQTDCPNPHDSNSDGAVTISDLLDLLGLFGDVDTDQDGVWDSVDDCVDTTACNYAADPTEACAFADALGDCGGGCEGDSDGDGICDDEDDCFGIVDECGICNGPGPTEIVIDEITILYDSVYAEQIDQWFVFEVGADTTFTYECAQLIACGDPVSYQGYDYTTVQIGDQCWFAENLRNENYENGDAIPASLSDSEWTSAASGSVVVYGEDLGSGCNSDYSPDINACDPAQSLIEYGRLYNWHAVNDERGLCPNGWHVPTDGEWMTMEMALGMLESEVNGTGWRGTDQGMQMKTTYGWRDGLNGTNTSGFSGLPGGGRHLGGYLFFNAGDAGYWWSSTSSESGAWSRHLDYWVTTVRRISMPPNRGYSVRCIQD